MITYNDLYELLRKEKYSEQIQQIPREFLSDVFEYFEDKKNFANKDEDFFSDIAVKNKKKLENAIANFRELFRIRKKKILNLSFVASEVGISKKDFENLIDFERELFEDIVKSLQKAEKSIGKEMSGKKEEAKNKLIRFLDNVSGFLNSDGQEIGPFEKGEIVNLEKEIAEILIQDRKAEEI